MRQCCFLLATLVAAARFTGTYTCTYYSVVRIRPSAREYAFYVLFRLQTRSSAIAEGPHDASCQLKPCQLPRNSAETTCTTSPGQIKGMKLEDYSGTICNKHVHSTVTRSSRFHCPIGVINKPTTHVFCTTAVYRRLAVAKFSFLTPHIHLTMLISAG